MVGANSNGTNYGNLINALSATVTNSHSATVTTPEESAITNQVYNNTKDYWLSVSRTDINAALINLVPYDTSDTAGSTADVQSYGFNSTLVGGTTGAHFVRYVLSNCTVVNDPIKTGALIQPLDNALSSIEGTFGDAEIIIQDGMQGVYDADTNGSLAQLIAQIDSSDLVDSDATSGMTPAAFTYGDSNDTNEGEFGATKQTVQCSVVASGSTTDLFKQINRLCSTEQSSLGTRTTAQHAADKFIVNDVLLLSTTSIFKTILNMTSVTGDNNDHPSKAQIATKVKSEAVLLAVSSQDWTSFAMDSLTTIFSNGNVFLQVIA
tara:strand:+ start:222 stop:1184 length:963 start_codon:yes stop_codon:yes gene_type:complete